MTLTKRKEIASQLTKHNEAVSIHSSYDVYNGNQVVKLGNTLEEANELVKVMKGKHAGPLKIIKFESTAKVVGIVPFHSED